MNFERELLTSVLSPYVRGEADRSVQFVCDLNRLSLQKGEGRVRVLP
jgi:hypothetical protein